MQMCILIFLGGSVNTNVNNGLLMITNETDPVAQLKEQGAEQGMGFIPSMYTMHMYTIIMLLCKLVWT